jgi:hypothetical protein
LCHSWTKVFGATLRQGFCGGPNAIEDAKNSMVQIDDIPKIHDRFISIPLGIMLLQTS